MSSQKQRLRKRKQRSPSPTCSCDQRINSNTSIAASDRNDLSKQTVWDFLECNEAVLQEYVQNNISEETVMKWLDDKSSVQTISRSVISTDLFNAALLRVFKTMFVGETIDMETMLQTISDEAVSLFRADRSSIFLVDKSKGELYAQVFGFHSSTGGAEHFEQANETFIEVSQEKHGLFAFKHNTEGVVYKGNPIKFPVSQGFAGYVVRTGETILCNDVANDDRFSSQVDQKTGYVTKTILGAPLKMKESICGVIELINKRNCESFTITDKDMFIQYVQQCSKIYETAKTFLDAKYSEKQYKVAMEMLAYHRRSNEDDVKEVKEATPLSFHKEQELFKLDMNTLQLNDVQHVQATFLMFSQLAHMSNLSNYFNSDVVLRFILTVSKNYRPVPYHGWYHGFWVAQSMFGVIVNHPEAFSDIERVALFTACLCHDLDHRGYTNNYFAQSNGPLAALYSTSIMEHHHFNQTLAILQTPGVDLFSEFDADNFKQILESMEHSILSTDLALLGKNRVQFEDLTRTKSFDWVDTTHKAIGQAILMVGCDISATARPWDMHKTTVDWLMQEFHKQGDEEKEIGLQPLELMDKEHQHKLPSFQIEFMKAISLPCYDLLSTILPSMRVLAERTRNNIVLWGELEESYMKPPPK